jgi:RNA polymerase sigma-70 factor (sigma-E family)
MITERTDRRVAAGDVDPDPIGDRAAVAAEVASRPVRRRRAVLATREYWPLVTRVGTVRSGRASLRVMIVTGEKRKVMALTPMRRSGGAAVDRGVGTLAELFTERYEPMVRLAYLVTADRGAAEEIVQDAFLALHRHWDRVEQPAAYLRTTVVNGCHSWGRRQTLARERVPVAPDSVPFVADEMWDALKALPERQRTAIVLRYYADLPEADIATILQCRQATVRSAVHRGIATLRKEIER